MERIYLSPPDVRDLERKLILEAIDSNWVAPVGPDLTAFEREIAAIAGVQHAVGLTSGTAALHLALDAIGIGPGDEVLVSTLTFAAPANAVRYTGAAPFFVDAEPATWCLSPDLTEEVLIERARAGRLPKAAVVVDLYGQCADYARLIPIFERFEIPIVEDAAEALGATTTSGAAGSFGTLGVFSFNGNKIVTTSNGGMLLCERSEVADRVRYLAAQARQPVVHYEHTEVGYNYRLSNLLAAFGRGQIASLSDRIDRRRKINQQYREALAGTAGISFMPIAPYGEPNHWLTCITIDPRLSGIDAESLRLRLEGSNIESRPVWKPMHLQPAFAGAPNTLDGTSDALFARGLCLPSGSGMTDPQFERVLHELVAAIPATH